MSKNKFNQRDWSDYDEEVYPCESTQDSGKQETWDERASINGKRGKKEHIRSLRKNKRSKRGDIWG